jgi:hypothetical protein
VIAFICEYQFLAESDTERDLLIAAKVTGGMRPLPGGQDGDLCRDIMIQQGLVYDNAGVTSGKCTGMVIGAGQLASQAPGASFQILYTRHRSFPD